MLLVVPWYCTHSKYKTQEVGQGVQWPELRWNLNFNVSISSGCCPLALSSLASVFLCWVCWICAIMQPVLTDVRWKTIYVFYWKTSAFDYHLEPHNTNMQSSKLGGGIIEALEFEGVFFQNEAYIVPMWFFLWFFTNGGLVVSWPKGFWNHQEGAYSIHALFYQEKDCYRIMPGRRKVN